MPDRHHSAQTKLRVRGLTVFIGTGFYDDGAPGEIFVDIARAGTDVRGMGHALALATSIALQHGASPAELAEALASIDCVVPRAVAAHLATEHGRREP